MTLQGRRGFQLHPSNNNTIINTALEQLQSLIAVIGMALVRLGALTRRCQLADARGQGLWAHCGDAGVVLGAVWPAVPVSPAAAVLGRSWPFLVQQRPKAPLAISPLSPLPMGNPWGKVPDKNL